MMINNKTVIHIEDREEDILLVERVLRKERENINIVSFKDSEKVLDDINNEEIFKLRPYLLLIDIKMPKISGFELLKALKSNKKFNKIPKVIWSSSSHPDDIKMAYDLGASSFLVKPKDYSNLKDTLLTTVNYWINFNHI